MLATAGRIRDRAKTADGGASKMQTDVRPANETGCIDE